MSKQRCGWVGSHPEYIDYHDKEWGRPEYDGRKLFEKFVLDSFQAGLSWITILRKRENFRQAFDNFNIEKIAGYGEDKVQELMNDAGIVRNQLKIRSTISNAQAYLRIVEEEGDFGKFLWQFVEGQPIVNHRKSMKDIPTHSKESDAMSKAMKKRGFRFCGTTICYAFMQAVGMVNDHTEDCFCYEEIVKAQEG